MIESYVWRQDRGLGGVFASIILLREYIMKKSNIMDYKNPSPNLVTDILSDFLRKSAQKM